MTSIAAFVSMFLIFYALVMFLRRRSMRRVAAAKTVAVETAVLAAARAQAAAAARAKTARALADAAALDLAVAEQATFEADFNARNRVRYDRHLRRRAVMFRLKTKLGRDLTMGEILTVKERVS